MLQFYIISFIIFTYFQGVYGYPIEIQALFFMALRCALVLLKQDDEGKEFVERIVKRLHALNYHMRSYFWLDLKQLNDIYRYKTEEYSHTAVNKFNVIPDSLPEWVFDFMPIRGGYFIGNVSPAKMDFRWFALGNCIAILSSLATEEQSNAIMDLIESRWEELVGEMPIKVCYPAIESHDWRIITGCDPKNTRWSYHNGGSWPGMFCFIHLLRKPLGLTQTPMPPGLLSVFVIVESAMPSFWPADQNLQLLLHTIDVSLSYKFKIPFIKYISFLVKLGLDKLQR